MNWIGWAAGNPLLVGMLGLWILAMLIGIAYAIARVLPKETIWPLLFTVAMHFMSYLLPRVLPLPIAPHKLALPIDSWIPFFPPMISVYLLAYVQWAHYWIGIGLEDRTLRSRSLAGEWIAKGICALAFVLFPTTMARPAVTGTTGFDRLVSLVYLLDAPTNLLPSMHCLQSWLVLRVTLQMRHVPRWYKPCTVVFSSLVIASTILVKQHVVLDLPTAILAAEFGLWLAPRVKFDRVYARWEERLSRR